MTRRHNGHDRLAGMFRRMWMILSTVTLGLIAGCGSGGTLPGIFDVSLMRGNWLVVGTLPQLGLAIPISADTRGVAMSLDVVSGQIVGSASLWIPCMNTGGAFQSAIGGGTKLIAATPDKDGNFVMEDVLIGSNTVHQFVIHGTLPRSRGESWSGIYTLTDPNAGCSPGSGEFTAVPVSLVAGTFMGAGTLTGSSAPVTLSASLQQGVPGSVNTVASPLFGENLISGTILVQGSPCFTSGTITQDRGALYGNFLNVEFAMNDGSLLLMTGDVADTGTSTLKVSHVAVSGGACDKAGGFSTSTLLKQ